MKKICLFSFIVISILLLSTSIFTERAYALQSNVWYTTSPSNANVTAYNKIGGVEYIATYEAVTGNANLYVSTDGTTSTKKYSYTGNRDIPETITEIVQVGSNIVLITPKKIVYASNYNGPWTAINTIQPKHAGYDVPYKYSPRHVVNNNKLWLISDTNFYIYYYDLAVSSTPVQVSSVNSVLTAFDNIYEGSDNALYAVVPSGSDNLVYKLVSGNWVYTRTDNVGPFVGCFSQYFKGNETSYLYGDLGSLYRSTDNGATWSLLPGAGGFMKLLEKNGSVYGVGTHAVVKDGVAVSGIEASRINNIFTGGGNIVVSSSRYLWVSTDGINFTQKKYGISENVLLYNFVYDSSYIYALGTEKVVYRSADNGVTWQDNLVLSPAGGTGYSMVRNNGKLYLGTSDGLYNSVDGVNFNRISTYASFYKLFSLNGKLWAHVSGLGGGNDLIYSADDGVTWNYVDATKLDIQAVDADSNFIYFVSSEGGSRKIYKIASPTDTPTLITTLTSMYAASNGLTVMGDGTFYVGTSSVAPVGVYYYNGSGWQTIISADIEVVQKVDANTVLVALANGRTVYRITHSTKQVTNLTYNLPNLGSIYAFYKHTNNAIFLAAYGGSYDPDVDNLPTPTLSVDAPSGSYKGLSKTLNFTVDANGLPGTNTKTFYTTDDTDPVVGVSSFKTDNTFTYDLSEGTTNLKMLTVDENGKQSNIYSYRYVLDGTEPTITVTPDPTSVTGLPETFTITTDDPDATIYYSLDGSDPSIAYTAPVNVNSDGVTLKVKAVDALGNEVTDPYLIDTAPRIDGSVPAYPVDGNLIIFYNWDNDAGVNKLYKYSIDNKSISVIANSEDKFNSLKAYGDYAVGQSGDGSLNLLKISTGDITNIPVTSIMGFSVSNQHIAWIVDNTDGTYTIKLYKISNGDITTITTLNDWMNDVDVKGDYVVWRETIGGIKKYMAYTISTGQTTVKFENPDDLWISSTLFTDGTNGYIRFDDSITGFEQIGKINFADKTMTKLTTSADWKNNFRVDNGKFVYHTDNINFTSTDVYLYDGNTVRMLKTDTSDAVIYGDIVTFWRRNDNKLSYRILTPPDITPPVLTASPAAGTYSSAQTVTLSTNETADIYYTTDGSVPVADIAHKYTTPITVSTTKTIKAFAVDTASNTSSTQTLVYTISIPSSGGGGGGSYYTPPVVPVNSDKSKETKSDTKDDTKDKVTDKKDEKKNPIVSIPKLSELPRVKTIRLKDITSKTSSVKKELDALNAKGIITTEKGYFYPDKQITRGEFVTLVMKSLKVDVKTDAAKKYADESKIPPAAKEYILKASALGLTNRTANNKFNFDQRISRWEMAQIIGKALELAQVDTTNIKPVKIKDKIPTWAKDAKVAIDAGIIKGFDDGTVRGTRTATKAEAGVMIYRLLN